METRMKTPTDTPMETPGETGAATAEGADAPRPGTRRRRPPLGSQRFGLAIAFLLLVAVFAAVSPEFRTLGNFFDVTRQVAVTAILAAGATLVILTGGIDLSVGSLVGLTALVSVAASAHGLPPVVALLLAVAAGAFVGLVNGALIARAGLSAFVVTLAALTWLRGVVYVGTSGGAVFTKDAWFAFFGQGAVAGVPMPALITLAVFAGCGLLLRRSVFGRHVVAVGANAEAARLTGVSVPRVLTRVYVISGVCAGIAGVIVGARLQSAVPDLGGGYELQAIAAVVLGGTSLSGGRGGIGGTLLGAMLIAVLVNGMTLLNVSSYYQLIIQGAVIVAAIALDRLRLRDGR
ncbi:ribose ABC transporter permease [Actinomadura rubrobrunea]|uniref:Ribose ABC transporter permease n=2 Tax=Actinomadura rubrobrunea TaxID=115335 RepID=A0A9W6PRX8_9ACTN|nr:ribose ABC transporter permease [Actinomadura rubrobrunea]